MIFVIFLFLLINISTAHAEEYKEYEPPPLVGTFEVKTSFWLPQSTPLKNTLGLCCNIMPKLQGGVLFHRRYGLEGGVGFLFERGTAVGTSTGAASQDRFRLILIPMEINIVTRFEHPGWRTIAPLLKIGGDAIYFHEKTGKSVIKGLKYGVHGGGGVQVQLTHLSDETETLKGLRDLFLTLEAQYQWMNSFGKSGLNLSGQLYSIGILFLF